jgi:hypothetical protein
MRKSAITLVFCALIWILFPGSSMAQQRKGSMHKPFILANQFKHSFGAGTSFYYMDKGQEPVFHLDYNPSLSLTKSYSDFSFSVGAQPAGGYHIASSLDDSAFIYADFPLLFELNFGNNASKDFYNDFGWFFGGGYSYHLFRDNWNHGPVGTIGVRAFVFGPSLTLRLSRYFAISESDRSLNTVTLLLNLGKYFEQVKLNNKVSRFK